MLLIHRSNQLAIILESFGAKLNSETFSVVTKVFRDVSSLVVTLEVGKDAQDTGQDTG